MRMAFLTWLDFKGLKNLTLVCRLDQDPESIASDDLQQEMQEASDLLMELQNQVASVSFFRCKMLEQLD